MDSYWDQVLVTIWPYVRRNFSSGYEKDDFMILGQMMFLNDSQFSKFLDDDVRPRWEEVEKLYKETQGDNFVILPPIFKDYSVDPMKRTDFVKVHDLLKIILNAFEKETPTDVGIRWFNRW